MEEEKDRIYNRYKGVQMIIQAKKSKQDQIKEYRKNVPDIRNGAYKKLYDKAISGKSRVAAMKAKCLDCVCWQPSEVGRCGIPSCPLYPYSHKKGVSAQDNVCESIDNE